MIVSNPIIVIISAALLVLCIGYAFRRSKMKRLSPSDFPNLLPQMHPAFEEWRRLEMKSIDAFLWTYGGLVGVNLLLSYVFSSVPPDIVKESERNVLVAQAVVALAGLTISWMYGSKAGKVKKALGNNWDARTSAKH